MSHVHGLPRQHPPNPPPLSPPAWKRCLEENRRWSPEPRHLRGFVGWTLCLQRSGSGAWSPACPHTRLAPPPFLTPDAHPPPGMCPWLLPGCQRSLFGSLRPLSVPRPLRPLPAWLGCLRGEWGPAREGSHQRRRVGKARGPLVSSYGYAEVWGRGGALGGAPAGSGQSPAGSGWGSRREARPPPSVLICPLCPRAASTTPRVTTASAARPASCAVDLRTLRPPASAALAPWLCLPTSKLGQPLQGPDR